LGLFLLHRGAAERDVAWRRATGEGTVTTELEPAQENLRQVSAMTQEAKAARAESQPARSDDPRLYSERHIAELEALGTDSDPAALAVITSELTNPDPEIREAAIEATVQFGSRDAIPALKEASTRIDDEAQRAEISKAISYLSLPTLDEVSLPRKTSGQS